MAKMTEREQQMYWAGYKAAKLAVTTYRNGMVESMGNAPFIGGSITSALDGAVVTLDKCEIAINDKFREEGLT